MTVAGLSLGDAAPAQVKVSATLAAYFVAASGGCSERRASAPSAPVRRARRDERARVASREEPEHPPLAGAPHETTTR